jgi:DNA polymerase III sliding clamp (beta) subunit (PCNA family)
MSDIEASVGQEVASGGQLAVTVSRDELAQKLSLVSRGVSTRTAVQILGGILLRAAGDNVELAATDMELSLRTPLGATVSGDGAVVVPGKLFADLSRLLPEGEVELEYRQDENVLQVRCGPAEYRLNTYSAEDFPRLPDAGATPTHAVDAASLLATVASVGRAVSRDEARPVLTGILVRFGTGSPTKRPRSRATCPSWRRSCPHALSRRCAGWRRPRTPSSSVSRRTRSCSASTARG